MISGSSQEDSIHSNYFKWREFNTRTDYAGGGREEKPKQKMGKQPRDEQQQEADATLRTEETQEKGDVTKARSQGLPGGSWDLSEGQSGRQLKPQRS